MGDLTDISTNQNVGNQILAQLVQVISDRSNSWNIQGVIPIIDGGTGATTAADARTNLGLVIGTDVQAYINYLNYASLPIRSITFIIDGGGAVISTGVAGDLEIPFACTINQAVLLADQTGSVVVDVWKRAYASYPPTVSQSITSATPPTISASNKSLDSTLSGWTTSISAGDTLRFNVNSVSSITRVTLSLKVTIA